MRYGEGWSPAGPIVAVPARAGQPAGGSRAAPGAIIEGMPAGKKARKRRKRPAPGDPLEAYRRIRKPVPPPERVVEDRRRKLEEEEAERLIQERE